MTAVDGLNPDGTSAGSIRGQLVRDVAALNMVDPEALRRGPAEAAAGG